MSQQARAVESTQTGPHEDLLKVVNKHRVSVFKRPIAMHTQAAFDEAIVWLSDWKGDVILDACCGVGESTLNIAQEYPQARVIGVDKSIARLQKHAHYSHKLRADKLSSEEPSLQNIDAKSNCSGDSGVANSALICNYLVLQADLNDFWRLLDNYLNHSARTIQWRLCKQYILYPNPYPKKAQLGKRWHGSAVFSNIIACCANIELRSNWKLYLEEFVLAAKVFDIDMKIEGLSPSREQPPITPFERKYAQSNQLLWTATTLGTGCDR
ncbi:SAM-dependent methyltransferase [Glaciecola sp. SC05]|uniref:SAM-dependent methyltransferase n=1 Tax=Glaciecola sp. SC05 TaxID=1987355 RepID=UPI003526F492